VAAGAVIEVSFVMAHMDHPAGLICSPPLVSHFLHLSVASTSMHIVLNAICDFGVFCRRLIERLVGGTASSLQLYAHLAITQDAVVQYLLKHIGKCPTCAVVVRGIFDTMNTWLDIGRKNQHGS